MQLWHNAGVCVLMRAQLRSHKQALYKNCQLPAEFVPLNPAGSVQGSASKLYGVPTLQTAYPHDAGMAQRWCQRPRSTLMSQPHAVYRKVYQDRFLATGMGRAPGTALAFMYWCRGFQLMDGHSLLTSRRACHPKLAAIRAATCDVLFDQGQEALVTINLRSCGWKQKVQVGTACHVSGSGRKCAAWFLRAVFAGCTPKKLMEGGRWSAACFCKCSLCKMASARSNVLAFAAVQPCAALLRMLPRPWAWAWVACYQDHGRAGVSVRPVTAEQTSDCQFLDSCGSCLQAAAVWA